MNWTPGPWTYEPIEGYQFVVVVKQPRLPGMAQPMLLIASGCPSGMESEVRANLALAAAAPDLYAALDAIIDAVFDDGTRVNRDHFAAARAALQKARGEQS